MVTTVRYASRKRRMTRRPKRPSFSPLEDTAKLLADILWERAQELAKALAPDHPVENAELEPAEQWEILEIAAQNLSPMYWDDPAAIRDLYRLRKEFAPETATEELLILARAAEKVSRITPDIRVTPENPEFRKIARRLRIDSQ